MSDYVDQVFGEDGVLANVFEGYEPRPSQIRFAREVDRAIEDGRHLVAECPTGTGKSIGYAVPAAYHAAQEGTKIVIATANISLQEQLVEKDLPFLREHLPWKFSFALAKGRQNYLCRIQERASLMQNAASSLNVYEEEIYARVRAWASDPNCSGDKSDLDVDPPWNVWKLFSTTSEDCLGRFCANFDDCGAMAALRRVQAADVVVCNYHLLFAHLSILKKAGVAILPPFDVAILDEVHEATDIAREFYGFRLGRGAFRGIRRRGQDVLNPGRARKALDELESHAHEFFDELDEFGRSDAYRVRFRRPYPVPEGLADRLGAVAEGAEDAADEAAQLQARDMEFEARRLADNALSALQGLEALRLDDDNLVVFLEPQKRQRDERPTFALKGKRIDVSGILAQDLFGTATTVSTSATISVGGSFDYVVSELGVAPRPRTLRVPSPFDFSRQALFVIPDGLPDPRDEDFPDAAAQAVRAAIEFARGRTLALFTSYKNLQVAREFLRHRTRYPVLCQGEAPRTKLVEEFKRDPASVLLGTKSFWQGLDVPGEALSCVVIDKIPFPQMGDPVVDAISAMDKRSFFNFSVPQAVITFKQGFGRLIRSRDDRGVVVLLDSRVREKSYGATFIKSLPEGTKKSIKLRDVVDFLGGADRA